MFQFPKLLICESLEWIILCFRPEASEFYKLMFPPTEDPEAAAAATTAADQGLPKFLLDRSMRSFHDIFSAARALSDADLLAAARQATNAAMFIE
jgi:hypothetical protein